MLHRRKESVNQKEKEELKKECKEERKEDRDTEIWKKNKLTVKKKGRDGGRCDGDRKQTSYTSQIKLSVVLKIKVLAFL